MDTRKRKQLDMIAEYELALALREMDERLKAIFAYYSSRGTLRSAMTLNQSVEAIAKIADALLAELSAKLKAVATDPGAFQILFDTVQKLLHTSLEQQLPQVTLMASGGGQNRRDANIELSAQGLFARIQQDIDAKLAIAEFDFDSKLASPIVQQPDENTNARKKGGRPPAEFWDNMWAAIAVKLFDGSLQPKTQADVEHAMADWITLNGYTAADSTVRGRARRLWDRLSAIE